MLLGITEYQYPDGRFVRYHSPHSNLGLIPIIQDIGRWNGSGYERVKEWLENGQTVYSTFKYFVPQIKKV